MIDSSDSRVLISGIKNCSVLLPEKAWAAPVSTGMMKMPMIVRVIKLISFNILIYFTFIILLTTETIGL